MGQPEDIDWGPLGRCHYLWLAPHGWVQCQNEDNHEWPKHENGDEFVHVSNERKVEHAWIKKKNSTT